MKTLKVSVFEHVDYRAFLAAYYRHHKKTERGFSYRSMTRALGFRSPNFCKMVIDGQRNLGIENLDTITQGLGLNKQESEYFSHLVLFAQAKNPAQKKEYMDLIGAKRARNKIAQIMPDQFEYFSAWYHPLVRELIAGKNEPLDCAALAGSIRPRATPRQIKNSVALLKRLGLVRLDNNRYSLSSPLLNTANEVNSFAVRQYHKDVLAVAQESLDNIPAPQRELSQVTVSVSPEGFARIKKRIQEFREELLHIVSEDVNTKDVYHVNIQFYPLTKPSHENKN
ncbi:MAG: TIGR02147 family protein [Chitinivibrionales bacterium]|nr:TIGR02147 family protein [Chitinivibrionales bacterium]